MPEQQDEPQRLHVTEQGQTSPSGQAPANQAGRVAEVARPEQQLEPGRVTVDAVRAHPFTLLYITAANDHLKLLGFTEHGIRHAETVSQTAQRILDELSYPPREGELAAIAGLLHDIGNVINRELHGQVGALMAKDILLDLKLDIGEIALVMGAIGNHEEQRGHAISSVAAALILADKADVHRSRVQSPETIETDIHDRVNYAATEATLEVQAAERRVRLVLTIDSSFASVTDYFEIFLSRMIMCRHAAEFLGCRFGLEINGTVL